MQQFEICSLVFRAFNVQQSTDDKLHEVGLVWYEDSRSSTFSSERNTYIWMPELWKTVEAQFGKTAKRSLVWYDGDEKLTQAPTMKMKGPLRFSSSFLFIFLSLFIYFFVFFKINQLTWHNGISAYSPMVKHGDCVE